VVLNPARVQIHLPPVSFVSLTSCLSCLPWSSTCHSDNVTLEQEPEGTKGQAMWMYVYMCVGTDSVRKEQQVQKPWGKHALDMFMEKLD
jgi:hypothetical protein